MHTAQTLSATANSGPSDLHKSSNASSMVGRQQNELWPLFRFWALSQHPPKSCATSCCSYPDCPFSACVGELRSLNLGSSAEWVCRTARYPVTRSRALLAASKSHIPNTVVVSYTSYIPRNDVGRPIQASITCRKGLPICWHPSPGVPFQMCGKRHAKTSLCRLPTGYSIGLLLSGHPQTGPPQTDTSSRTAAA